MYTTRRDTLKMMTAAAGSGLGAMALPGLGGPALAQAGRSMQINLLGFTLGIHVPSVAAVMDIMPGMGYAAPKIQRLDQIRTMTQTLIAGAAEIGDTDPITTIRAVEAGADLKIVGHVYLHTSLIFVVNADKIKELKDLEKPDSIVAVNSKGDITHIMLVGPLIKRGVDVKKVNIVEIGGSGGRMKALLSGRVHAVPIHFDQAAEVLKQGNYKILVEPWKEYSAWVNEVWAVNGAWLKKKENERALIDTIKATITAFRKSNDDAAWYGDMYRKHATLPKAKETTNEALKPLWDGLRNDVKAWPRSMDFKVSQIEELIPIYKAADAVAGTVTAKQVVDTSFVEQALKELGG